MIHLLTSAARPHTLQPVVNPRIFDVDVAVFGGGVAGTMAAVAAARQGARVLLVERYGFLGGNATAGAVAQFNCWQTGNGRRVIAGLAQEVVERLRKYKAAGPHENFVMSTGHRMDRVTYSPEILKLVLDEMVLEAGVRPLLHSALAEVAVEERHVAEVGVLNRGGRQRIQAGMFIDASGDAQLLFEAGARFVPLEAGESLQPATMMFRFGPIDFDALQATDRAKLTELARQGHAEGHLARQALHHARDPDSDDAWFNIGRLPIDATDPAALSMAEIEGRRQAWRAAQFLAERVPGCAQGRLRAFGTQVGIRETRRVLGEHILNEQELIECRRFDDTVALGAYPIDIHPAQGGGLDFRSLGPDDAYGIPLRSLIPVGLDNCLAVGRGISATHEALAAIRVMTISMAVGQAAGVAAAMTVSSQLESPRQVPAAVLRKRLVDTDAVLE
ncbi:MAG: hypothetical protein RLZ83_2118 [Pseudomonadota bacterium]